MTHQVASQRASKAQAEDTKRKRREEQEGNVARKVRSKETGGSVQCASAYACGCSLHVVTALLHARVLHCGPSWVCSQLSAQRPALFVLLVTIRPPPKKKSARRNARGAKQEWPQQPRLRKKKERAARKEGGVEEGKAMKEAMRNRSPHIEKHFGARLYYQPVHF